MKEREKKKTFPADYDDASHLIISTAPAAAYLPTATGHILDLCQLGPGFILRL